MVTLAALQELQAFRSKLYDCCTRRRDALFELVDALLTADSIPSLAVLSLEPSHRRGWGSTYAALATGQVDAEGLRTLLAPHQNKQESTTKLGELSGGVGDVQGGAPQLTPITPPAAPTRQRQPGRHHQVRRAGGGDCPPARGRCLCSTPATTPFSSARAGRHRRGDPGAAARWPLLLRRPPPAPRSHKAAGPPPGRQARHRRPDRWPAPDRSARQRRRPVRRRHGGRMGGAASQAAAAPDPRDQATPTHRPRHPDRRAGQPHPGADASTQGAMAVVAGPRHARPGGAVAGLRAPLRPRAHHPLLQADPWLDHPKGAASRAGRAVDLARPGRLHPAPLARASTTDQPAAMGTAAAQHPADAGSRPPRVSRLLRTVGSPANAPKPCGRSPGRPQGSRAGPAKRHPAIKKTR